MAIIVGLSIIGLVGTAGLGIDFFNALAFKSRLDLASDAAAIAAINAAQDYITKNPTQVDPALTTGAIAAAKAQAQKVFNSNAGSTIHKRPRRPSQCRGPAKRSTRAPIKPRRKLHLDRCSG